MRRPNPAALLLFVVGLSLAGLAMPRAAVACSCAMISMADSAAEPDAVVFTGIVDPRDGRGYPVTVTRWFKGGGIIEPRVWLHPGGFSLVGGGADCSVPPLPVGAEYIFIAYRAEDMYSVGLCSPHASLATQEGQAMLAEANQTFGGVQPSATDPPSAPSPPTAPSSAPSPSAAPAAPASMIEAVAPFALAIFGIGVVIGVVGVLRRTRARKD
jgi:hypothetical protein